jgi:HK97 family phage prohead protease
MKRQSYEITEFKADVAGPRGLFVAKVSVFGNVDKNGDRMMHGAFGKSIQKKKAANAVIPVIWSHEHKDPASYIGEVQARYLIETEEGLIVSGRLDIDSNPMAAQVFDLLQKGRVREWSFGYEVKDERLAKDLARELYEVDLIEVGPTLVGANPETRTLVLKEAEDIETKIGRTLSAKTRTFFEERIAAMSAELTALQDFVAADVAAADEEEASTPEAAEVAAPVESSDARRDILDTLDLFVRERTV